MKAVIAESYERIHRSNLIGMGVLPLQFPEGETAESLGLTGEETFSITGVTALNDGTTPRTVKVKADGDVEFDAVVRIDTPGEATTTATAGSCSTSCATCVTAGPMIVAVSISPSGADETGGVSEAVADAVRRDPGVRAARRDQRDVHQHRGGVGRGDGGREAGRRSSVAETSPRVGLVLKADLRRGHDSGQLAAKVDRVEELLAGRAESSAGEQARRARRRRRALRDPVAPARARR